MTMEIKDDNHLATSDLGFGAYLLSSGLPLLGLHWQEDGRAEFIFEVGGYDLATLIARYFSGTGQVPALSYKASLDELKTRLHRERRKGA